VNPTKIDADATTLNATLAQCSVWNSRATCLSKSAEWTAVPSMNMISLRGQKNAIENRPSHTIMSTLNRIQYRADFTRQPRIKAPKPVTQERKPRGGKKSLGALTDMNCSPSSSDRGGSWKTLG